VTDANINSLPADQNDGTNSQATDTKNAIIPEGGTKLDTPAYTQFGKDKDTAIVNLIDQVENLRREKTETNNRFSKLEDRLDDKENYINQQAEEIGRSRQTLASQELLENVSRQFSDIMESDNSQEKLAATQDIAKSEIYNSHAIERKARSAFYTTIEKDPELKGLSFDWIRHKAEESDGGLHKIGSVKSMKTFLNQIRPRQSVDESVLRDKWRKEWSAEQKTQNLAVATGLPAGNSQMAEPVDGAKRIEDMKESDILKGLRNANANQGFGSL